MNTTYQDMTKTQRALYQLKLTAIIMFTGERLLNLLECKAVLPISR